MGVQCRHRAPLFDSFFKLEKYNGGFFPPVGPVDGHKKHECTFEWELRFQNPFRRNRNYSTVIALTKGGLINCPGGDAVITIMLCNESV